MRVEENEMAAKKPKKTAKRLKKVKKLEATKTLIGRRWS
jgi:hypothetical protein